MPRIQGITAEEIETILNNYNKKYDKIGGFFKLRSIASSKIIQALSRMVSAAKTTTAMGCSDARALYELFLKAILENKPTPMQFLPEMQIDLDRLEDAVIKALKNKEMETGKNRSLNTQEALLLFFKPHFPELADSEYRIGDDQTMLASALSAAVPQSQISKTQADSRVGQNNDQYFSLKGKFAQEIVANICEELAQPKTQAKPAIVYDTLLYCVGLDCFKLLVSVATRTQTTTPTEAAAATAATPDLQMSTEMSKLYEQWLLSLLKKYVQYTDSASQQSAAAARTPKPLAPHDHLKDLRSIIPCEEDNKSLTESNLSKLYVPNQMLERTLPATQQMLFCRPRTSTPIVKRFAYIVTLMLKKHLYLPEKFSKHPLITEYRGYIEAAEAKMQTTIQEEPITSPTLS